MNPLVYAYLGDAIYECHIREYLIKKKICKVNDLHKEAVKYVGAVAQAKFLKQLKEMNFFNDEEQDFIKRARNQKTKSSPKGTDILTYKHATALEAIIGYLYLKGDKEKLDKIMKIITEE